MTLRYETDYFGLVFSLQIEVGAPYNFTSGNLNPNVATVPTYIHTCIDFLV